MQGLGFRFRGPVTKLAGRCRQAVLHAGRAGGCLRPGPEALEKNTSDAIYIWLRFWGSLHVVAVSYV